MDNSISKSIANYMRNGSEAVYVFSYEKILYNCYNVKKMYPNEVNHYFDIRAQPNLSVVHAIQQALGCRVVVPFDEWKSYVALAGISRDNIEILSNSSKAVNTIGELEGFLGHKDSNDHFVFLLQHSLLDVIIAKSEVQSKLSANKVLCVFDISTLKSPESEKARDKVCILSKKIRCAVLHGENLLADTSTLWLKVRSVKKIQNKEYIILSGGANILWDATQNGNAFRHKYRILPSNKNVDDELSSATFCGPLCTPQDTLAVDYPMSELLPGDVVAVENVGSSMYHKSPFYFISHPKPSEMMQVCDRLYPLNQPRNLSQHL